MSLLEEQKKFLLQMGIDVGRFESLGRDIQILIDIANDYEVHKADLLDEASYVANKLQRCEGVHTVRSRIKDTSHLVEKIIRKWESKEVAEKYDTISKDNYKSIISDLIGVRAIYLFKRDWEIVHNHILSKWQVQEEVVIYHREGDDLAKYEHYTDCKKEVHDKGYRSIHYIIPATKIEGQSVNCEIQTRTIFEEGWSEIDHKVRYPSFSDDPYLQEFLDIFNRTAGTADEMGSFVNSLRELIKVNVLLEENKRLTSKLHEEKIRELEEKIDQLFKSNAALEEVEAAYNSLKEAQNQKNKDETTDSQELLRKQNTTANPTLVGSFAQDILKANLSSSLLSAFYNNPEYINYINNHLSNSGLWRAALMDKYFSESNVGSNQAKGNERHSATIKQEEPKESDNEK